MARGKAGNTKFDTWNVVRGGETRTFEIRYHSPEQIGSGNEKAYFSCTNLNDPPINATAFDLETLRTKIITQWDDSFGIHWKPVIKISVAGVSNKETHYSGGDSLATSVTLHVSYYVEGCRKDGKWFHYNCTGHKVPSRVPAFLNRGQVLDATVSGAAQEGTRTWVIDDTPEARQAIQSIVDGITAVTAQVEDFVGQQVVAGKTTRFAGFLHDLLNSPSEVTEPANTKAT